MPFVVVPTVQYMGPSKVLYTKLCLSCYSPYTPVPQPTLFNIVPFTSVIR